MRKWLTSLGSWFFFQYFIPFPFSPFLIFCCFLLLGVFPVHTILRKHHRDGNFYLRTPTCGRRILLRVFHSNFWAFSWKCQAPLSRSLWSGYHWKDSSCDDVRSGTKTKARHSRLRATRESMGNIPSQRSGWGDVAQTRYSGILTRLSKHILSFPDELNIVFSGNMCPSDFS